MRCDRLALFAPVLLALSALALNAQLPLQPFTFHEGFEEEDAVEAWVSNGESEIAFKGLTDEAAFEGTRSFKLDLTINSGSYHYWSLPVRVAAEGKLKLSARLRVGEGNTAAVGVGTNFIFPPTHHSGCGPIERYDKATGDEWKLIEGDLVQCGKDSAAGVMPRHAPTVAGDQVGPILDRVGIFIYGGQGKRAVLYLDDVRIEGEAPELKAFEAEAQKRFAPARQAFAAQVAGWRRELNEARGQLDRFEGLPRAAERARDGARKAIGDVEKLLAAFDQRPYAGAAELGEIDTNMELIRYTPQALAAIADGTQQDQPFLVHNPPAIANLRIRPNVFPVPARIGSELTIAACRGEYESATFALYALDEIKGLRVSPSALTGPGDPIPAEAIETYVVKCWYQAGRGIGDLKHKQLAPELLLKDDRLVRVDLGEEQNLLRSTAEDGAERYVPCSGQTSEELEGVRPIDAKALQPVDMPAGIVKQFWLTLHVPDEAEPGEYSGSVKLSAEGMPDVQLPLALTVYPFELAASPLTYSIYYRGKVSPDGKGTISSEWKSPAQYEAEMRDFLAHGVLYPTIYQPFHEDALAQALDIRRTAGLPGGPLYSLGIGTGNATDAEGLDALQANVKRWQEYIAPFDYDELYIYGIDEAKGERLKSQRAAWAAAREAGAKVFVACYKQTFEAMGDLLDVAVLAGKPDPEERAKYHGLGRRAFCYAYPQVGNEEPETYRRNFGLVLWQAGFDGAMDYAYQHSFGHIWNDFDHKTYRDHNFTYPTVDGIVGTVQWEGFREAVDDVRYVTTLVQAIEGAPAAKQQTAAQAQQWLDGLDPSGDLYAIRAQMAEWILKLQ